jgi:hypothetical protein
VAGVGGWVVVSFEISYSRSWSLVGDNNRSEISKEASEDWQREVVKNGSLKFYPFTLISSNFRGKVQDVAEKY